MYQTVAFVDFDGTITLEDTLEGAIRLFADEGEYRAVRQQLVDGEITLSQAVRHAFDGAPSDRLPRMLDYVDGVGLRPGFPEFLEEMERREIPVVVISGGIRQFVERKLSPFAGRFLGLHAVDLDVSGPGMRLVSPCDDGVELLKKTAVMARYPCRRSLGVGDSFTDCRMALAVDTVFARDELARYLEKQGRPYVPYESFFDVIQWIRENGLD